MNEYEYEDESGDEFGDFIDRDDARQARASTDGLHEGDIDWVFKDD